MATPIRHGLPATNRLPTQRRCLSSRTTTSSACSTRRASPWSRSALVHRRTHARCGESLRGTTICFAAHPRGCGSTPPSAPSSAWKIACARRTRRCCTTPSTARWPHRRCGRGRCTTASVWRCWQRPIRRWTRWCTTRRSAHPDGRAGSSRRFGRTPVSTRSLPAFTRTCCSWAGSRGRTHRPTPGTLRRCATGVPSSRRWVQRRPTTDTSMPTPPTCPWPTPPLCMPRCSPGTRARPRANSSRRRC